jgi:hypothetical protein
MLGSVLDVVFGCPHRRTSFPFTPARKAPDAPPGNTYVVCLDCGKQLAYDWKEMRLGGPVHKKPAGKKSKLRYVLWGAALPVAWLIGSAFKSRKNSRGS